MPPLTRAARPPLGHRVRRWAVLGSAFLLAATATGCADLSLFAEAAFPPAVPGLPPDAQWLSLPIGPWLTEGGVEARAISACLAVDCPQPAAAAVFTARGARAAELARALDDPAGLARELARRMRARPAPVRERAQTVVVEASRDSGLSGYAVRLARSDGSRPAVGLVMGRRDEGAITVVLVIAAEEAVARATIRAIAAGLNANAARPR